jgi:hypothetical protein
MGPKMWKRKLANESLIQGGNTHQGWASLVLNSTCGLFEKNLIFMPSIHQHTNYHIKKLLIERSD